MNPGTIDAFLAELNALEPADRLRELLLYPNQDDTRVQAAIAWWRARYRFADKKQQRTADKFVWLLLCLSARGGQRDKNPRQVTDAYRDAFLSDELKLAIDLDNRLAAEITDACALYVGTLSPHASVFGMAISRNPDQKAVHARISGSVAGNMIPPLYDLCREFPYADMVMKSLFDGAKAAYPGLQPALMHVIQQYRDAAMRQYVLDCVRPEGF